MNPKHFHTPASTRARCPVCHEAVYSRAGIHPQCAVRQSEPPRAKAEPKVAVVEVVTEDASIPEPPVIDQLPPVATALTVDPPGRRSRRPAPDA